MKKRNTMTLLELRATLSLASIFALRMFGMFIILPVFTLYAASLPGGDNKFLVGLAMGGYGLTQAILQIPLGMLSDRIGRKQVIVAGLLIFALGSFVAAEATTLPWIIVGRLIQGSGAIAAAIIALAGDLTQENNRTSAMAIIGVTIGLTFSASMVLAPLLSPIIGVPGIFALTGVLSLLAIFVAIWVVPNPTHHNTPPRGSLLTVLLTPALQRMDFGIFVLHATLMATFVVVPSALTHLNFEQAKHWKLYLPIMVASFILMIPGIILSHGKYRKTILTFSGWSLILVQLFLAFSLNSFWGIASVLLLFFTLFNILEASFPSMVTVLAPLGAKGAATGVFSTSQFLGVFFGASSAGAISQWLGPQYVPIFCALLILIWTFFIHSLQFPNPANHSTNKP